MESFFGKKIGIEHDGENTYLKGGKKMMERIFFGEKRRYRKWGAYIF